MDSICIFLQTKRVEFATTDTCPASCWHTRLLIFSIGTDGARFLCFRNYFLVFSARNNIATALIFSSVGLGMLPVFQVWQFSLHIPKSLGI